MPAWASVEPAKSHTSSSTSTGSGDEDSQNDEDPKEKVRSRAKDLANKLVNSSALKGGGDKSSDEIAKDADEDSTNMGEFIGEITGDDGKFDEEFATAANDALNEIHTELTTRLAALPEGPSPERTELQAQIGRVQALQGFIANQAPPGSVLARGPGASGGAIAGTTGPGSNSNGSALDVAGKSGGTSDPGKSSAKNSQLASNQGSTQPLKSLPLPSASNTTSPQVSQPAVAQAAPQNTQTAQPAKSTAKPPTIYTAAVDKATQAIKALEANFFGPKETAKSEPSTTQVASAKPTKEGVVTARESVTQRPSAETPKSFTPPALSTSLASVNPSTTAATSAQRSSTAFSGDESFDFKEIESGPPAPVIASAGSRPYAPEAPRGVTTIEQDFFAQKTAAPIATAAPVETAQAPDAPVQQDVVSLRTVASSRGALSEFASEMKRGLETLKERLTADGEPESESPVQSVAVTNVKPKTTTKPTPIESQVVSAPTTAEAKPGGSVLQFMNLMKQKAQENPA